MSNLDNRGPNNFVISAVRSCNFDRNKLKKNWSRARFCCAKDGSYSIEYLAEQPVQQIERLEQTNKL